MLFKHPEVLYGLFLLVIPVLVHLFQLRRFQKEKFTNVKFLKKAVLQTRKSSTIKKWLILFLRLAAFACIIVAFSQPFIPSSEAAVREQETVIYLDNSYSMQAKGQQGILLKRSVQDLLEVLPRNEKITLFTNDRDYKDADFEFLKRELQNLPYSPSQLEWETVSAKAESYFSNSPETDKVFMAISDFQLHEGAEEIEVNEGFQPYLIKLQPERDINVVIDSAFISEQNLDETLLSVSLRSSGDNLEEIPISLYNGPQLLAKRVVTQEHQNSSTINFPLPSGAVEDGRIEIEDQGLDFDNSLYFSLNSKDPIQVVVIGDGDTSFLQKIYGDKDFDLDLFTTNQIDFSKLSSAEMVILNEATEISLSLQSSLGQLAKDNVLIVIIPSDKVQAEIYNPLLRELNLPLFTEKIGEEKLITEIVYDHPFFRSVFEDQVENFQYPEVKSYFRLNRKGEKILGFENEEEFLLRKDNVFLFTAALNEENSNFQKAPLIVPTFYNLGNMALTPAQLYYTLGQTNQVDVPVQLDKDEILSLESEDLSFIPLQQTFPNKVSISLDEKPAGPGSYQLKKDSTVIKTLSFNVNRKESHPEYRDLDEIEGVQVEESIPTGFSAIESKTEINALWKWFAIFALFFFMTEMLILKFYK